MRQFGLFYNILLPYFEMRKRSKESEKASELTVKKEKVENDFDEMAWSRILVKRSELNLQIVLKCGQSFRWSQARASPPQWVGVLQGKLFVLSQTDDELLYKVMPENSDDNVTDHLLTDYFQLKVDLEGLYKTWSAVDPVFNEVSLRFPGIRMLRQDPVENVFSFICSSNNNIQRISSMVENLCSHFGEKICDFDDKSYFAFPNLTSLSRSGVEERLRTLGFGYRAGYIAKTAKQLLDKGGATFLQDLRAKSYEEARKELLTFTGIGPKVADCILLMSLDKPAAIPVDTHMFQIAANQYLPHLKQYKSVTDKVYLEISRHFQTLYGDYAGWAHSVLFSADLKHLQNLDAAVRPEKKPKISKKKCLA